MSHCEANPPLGPIAAICLLLFPRKQSRDSDGAYFGSPPRRAVARYDDSASLPYSAMT